MDENQNQTIQTNKPKTIIWLIIVLIVIVGGYFLIKGNQPTSTEPIKIGLSTPLTGEGASFGEAMLGGAQLAVKEINDAGGILGRQVELVVEDDKCNSTGASVFQKLIEIDKVVAITGPICSAAAGPGVPIAQKAGIPVVLNGASAPGLTKVGDYIFRDYFSDAFQGKFAAEYFFNTLKKNKAAVIYVKNDWGQGIKEVFVNRFKEIGGQVVFEEGVVQDMKDFRTLLVKAKAANPDSFYLPIYPANAAGALKQIVELGIKLPVLGGDAFGAEEVFRIKEAQGVLYVEIKTTAPEDFLAKVKSVTGKTPLSFTPFAYDAVKIVAEAIRQAGSTDGKAIRDKLATMVYKDSVATPTIEFDSNRELKSPDYNVMIINNGQAEKYTK